MLIRCLYIIINYLTIITFANGENILDNNVKDLEERDSQSCVDDFAIHRDKIIKTLDSQKLGAKYLTVIDVNSEGDCIKLCCMTDQCDVFIFEEKRPGSCYLFHCGPPQDFKCKFTDHTNYSSAVLTNYKYSSLQLEEQIGNTQEHELQSLRKHESPKIQEYPHIKFPSMTVIRMTTTTTVKTTPPTINIDCSRNQFECRMTRECIAIYNVCDGIPQCSDGSDEAGELHCPTEKPSSPIPPSVIVQKQIQSSFPDVIKYQQPFTHHQSYSPYYGHVQETDSKSWQSPPGSPPQVLSPQQNLPYSINSENNVMQSRSDYRPRGFPWHYQPYYDQNKEGYDSFNYLIPDQNIPPVYEQHSHIFKYKKPGVVKENIPDRPIYVEQNKPLSSYYQQSNQETWHREQTLIHPSVAPVEHHTESEILQQPIVTTSTPSIRKVSSTRENVNKKNNEDIAKNESNIPRSPEVNGNENQVPEQMKSIENKVNLDNPEVVNDENSKLKQKDLGEHMDITRKERLIAQYSHHHNHQEDEIPKPTSAIISLTIGASVSVVMAILVACRFRVLRRRGQRGHEQYAHDADYLVNGMYL